MHRPIGLYVLQGDFDDHRDNTQFRDMNDNLGTHYPKSEDYKVGAGYYSFGHAGTKDSEDYNNAKEDYEKIEKKLKELFPGIKTILNEFNWNGNEFVINLKFQKDVTFTHPRHTDNKEVENCEITRVFVHE